MARPTFESALELVEESQGGKDQLLSAAIIYAGETIAYAISELGTGGMHGPGAIEAIAMAIGGHGLVGSIAGSLDSLAEAVHTLEARPEHHALSLSLDSIAEAIVAHTEAVTATK